LLGWMCPDGTQCRQGSPDAPDATRCGVWVLDAQDAGQGPGRECQDATLLYLTQATFLLMLRPDASNIFFASYASCAF